jgi:hypothetical protein
MKNLLLVWIVLLWLGGGMFSHVRAQKCNYLVVHSTKRYISARLVAEQSAKLLELPINLRGLNEHPVLGLSLAREACLLPNGTIQYPRYPLRKPKQNGRYVSIEYSSAYPGWVQGYYLVVASGYESDAEMDLLLKRGTRILS